MDWLREMPWWYSIWPIIVVIVAWLIGAIISALIQKRRKEEFKRLFGFIPNSKLKKTDVWIKYRFSVEEKLGGIAKEIIESTAARDLFLTLSLSRADKITALQAIDCRIISLLELKEHYIQVANWFELSPELGTKERTQNQDALRVANK